jgi:excisionase family DNA binding protein
VLVEQKGNIASAAEVLDISRSTLYEKVKKHGIELPRAGSGTA